MTDYYARATFASIKNFCLPDGKAENLGHPICLAICTYIHIEHRRNKTLEGGDDK